MRCLRIAALCGLLAAPAMAQDASAVCGEATGLGLCGDGPSAAWYSDPTERYDHGVLGDAIEWGALVLRTGGAKHRVVLPDDRVFEDIAPRLKDIDGDGRPEIVVVESQQDTGAQLAIYALRGGALTKIAATPHIGQSNRWLAPFAVADLDGDGVTEIAYIDRPHLAKTLRIWRYMGGSLREVVAARGLTNHRIGEDFISGGVRDCGDGPELVTADAGWRRLVATRFDGTSLAFADIGAFRGQASFAAALACKG